MSYEASPYPPSSISIREHGLNGPAEPAGTLANLLELRLPGLCPPGAEGAGVPRFRNRAPAAGKRGSLARIIKRSSDYVIATLALLVLWPLLLAIALVVRLDSPGPVFFVQERLGLGGRRFRMFKFRTMCLNAEEKLKDLEHLNESAGHVLFKMKRDPRVTRVGSFLRRTSMDELPQLFNVLLGQMSLVGPRPLPVRDCERLEVIDAERFARRHEVPPGLTGLWQVSGRSRLGADQMVLLDCRYIETWSLWLDLRILVRTVGVVLSCTRGCP